MVNITNENNSVVFQIDDSQVLSFPMNELSVLTEEVSDIVMFKTAKNFKTVVQERWEEITINGEPITKENVIDKFNEIANTNEGGAKINAGTNITLQEEADGSITISATGELGGTVAWADVTDKPETFTPSAHNHVVADITDLQGKLDAKQDTLVSGENIKTINGQTILGSGNIEIQGGGSGISDAPSDNKLYGRKNANWSEIIIPSTDNFATKSEIADMLTKTEASEKYQPKGEYLTEVPAEYVTETELSSKGYLTAIPEEYVTNEELTSALSSKQDKGDYITVETADGKYQVKGDYATKAELADKANTSDLSNYLQTSVAESTYAKKSEIPEEYTLPIATADLLGGIKVGAGLSINPGTGVLSATGGGTADSVDWANITSKPDDIVNITDKLAEKLDVSTYNSEKATFATKEELAGKANTSDLSNYLTTTNAESTYAKKSEIPSLEGYLQTSTADEKYATKTELEGKVDDADIADMLTKTEAASTYQPIGDYLTEVPAEYITESELDAKGYKKIVYLTQTQYDELPTKEEGVMYVITDAPEVVIPDTSTFATKAELEGKADKTSVPVAQQEYEEGDNTKYIYAANSYQNKTFNVIADLFLGDRKELELYYKWWGRPNNSEAVSIRNASQSLDGAMSAEDKTKLDSINVETLATKEELSAKQDTLVSGTNIKTVNGESILGSGNIAIGGGAPGYGYIISLNTVNADNIFGFYSLDNSGDGARYPYKLTSRNGIKITQDNNNAAFIEPDTEVLLTKTEASTTYALQTALQAALDRIAALESQVGNISTQLDNINGEIV